MRNTRGQTAMIRQTVKQTIAATYLVSVPDPNNEDFPTPSGTGFFVSPEGLFVTAYHVAKDVHDPRKIVVTHEAETGGGAMLRNPDLVGSVKEFDLAVLKFDFASHSDQEAFKGKTGFDFLEVDLDEQYEGTPVYSFGYPLPEYKVQSGPLVTVGLTWICPRVTSAVISSRYEVLGPVRWGGAPRCYVLDKAFNYGNSGGPIVLQETGKAIAAVVRFQPVVIDQPGQHAQIMIPSLYGIASSLRNIDWDKVRRVAGSAGPSPG
jgi:S1-C subfamily serine protease